MKATGIIRRIDDLGRIVIPKEIRKTMHIRESNPLEIFTEKDGSIILKKYSPIGEMGSNAQQCAESIASQLPHTVCIWSFGWAECLEGFSRFCGEAV